MKDTSHFSTNELHQCALLLADGQMPQGWAAVGSSVSARVAHHREQDIFYKEFLPRSPLEPLKALFKGSRATRARSHSEALALAGFDAPENVAWGKLSKGREYLFTRAIRGEGVDKWLGNLQAGSNTTNLQERRRFLRELGIFIGRLHATGFTHGDLRSSNVLAYKGPNRFEFGLIDNERNKQQTPAAGTLLLKNLMQLNMHTSIELSRTDRLRFFKAWASQMKELSELEARLIASQAYRWAVKRLTAKGRW